MRGGNICVKEKSNRRMEGREHRVVEPTKMRANKYTHTNPATRTRRAVLTVPSNYIQVPVGFALLVVIVVPFPSFFELPSFDTRRCFREGGDGHGPSNESPLAPLLLGPAPLLPNPESTEWPECRWLGSVGSDVSRRVCKLLVLALLNPRMCRPSPPRLGHGCLCLSSSTQSAWSSSSPR